MITQKRALRQLKEIKKYRGDMRLAASGWANEFQTLVAILLSARTRDETTIKVCDEIFSKYPTHEEFSKLSLDEIKKLIRPVNFYKTKAKNIFNLTKKIKNEFNGLIPETIDELVTLPGIGRKTANVFLAEYGNDSIGVDTHVNYISNYLGWVNSNKPEAIEKELEKLFPKENWRKLNNTLVSFGKKYTSRKEKDNLLDEIKRI